MNKVVQLKWNLLIGLVIIGINLCWIWDNLYLLYQYHNANIFFFFMYPDWALVSNSVLGLVGATTGILTVFDKLTIKKGISVCVFLIASGIVIKSISVN
ncbi:hypothetical protein BC643_3791 [Mangrovibacterium diazotrophicum]|uniref:Uncharacterized protein n=1 Tax=Mangrovibacterium diazotrophicum TaxID=1261403 RepID=A0A419VX89_9BACT|nr:hypothetical protein BC643_3791 [Mangrovibacterium diazotrophicum]